jgi:hypothetical protein
MSFKEVKEEMQTLQKKRTGAKLMLLWQLEGGRP